MGLARKDSVKVADVLVPQRLMSTRNRNKEWRPQAVHDQQAQDEQDQEDVQLQRWATVEHDAPANSHVGRPRKTSDPITLREARSARSSVFTSKEDLSHYRTKHQSTASSLSVADSFQRFNWDNSRRPDNAVQSSASSAFDWEVEPEHVPQRSGTVKTIVRAVVPDVVLDRARSVAGRARRSSIAEVYEKAKVRGKQLERKKWVQILFEYTIYLLLLSFIYFVLVGLPLWKGAVWWLYWVVSTKFVITGGCYAFAPLLILFEKEPPMEERLDRESIPGVHNTALLIPCYKSENIIGPTLEAALKIFPPSHIFVIANGNSETPLDNTEEVCQRYGVRHIWSSVGSKIVAQYVGCHKARRFQNVLLIDDDCALPPNFPVVSDRLVGKVKSIGYTIKSVGPPKEDGSGPTKGTWCQQAQDLEYKLSGLQRIFAGKVGSATFPHGAISLWDRKFLVKTFNDHPGYSVSEDWFFGDSCRRLGGRIVMCSSVFVETETPSAVFFSSGGSRGGFGEMTIFKQRFMRWNFFFVNGLYYNMKYIIKSWRLGWWEIGAKFFVFQEVYETLLYLFTPFILPISFIVRPDFCGYLLAGTVVMYLVNVIIFNEIHLRLRKERISWAVLIFYYMPYKLVLTAVNVASCYWSLFKYAKYFAKRHPKIIEDARAVEVAMKVEEQDDYLEKKQRDASPSGSSSNESSYTPHGLPHMTAPPPAATSFSRPRPRRLSFTPGVVDSIPPSPTRPEPARRGVSQFGVQASDFAAQPAEALPRSSAESGVIPAVADKTKRSNNPWAYSPV
ncbi:hypothetical protein JX265_005729 [Neoarthrinium moseri]|uniref:Uncharacterized protein n=1 Tax=Neoarthrinium moseri TaxID=1658444 RepID=A0A9P9WNC7_9PEZI|nr:uncharacterized protein JN550_013395 [Neoarthrinium moseri]KAI1857212.1 hypothetical protein JN550_013395 [Neoarthrinium moseri]KAI1871743.1 hypothetical protein JX265_005729 [Neoarthrinium moseri]